MSKHRSRAIGAGAILAGGLALLAGSGLAAAAAAPANSRLPQIHGTVQVGQTLTASEGRWKGTQPITFAYQWQRCNSSGGSCGNILSSPSGSASYVVTQADVGNRLIVVVTATNKEGTASAASQPSPVVRTAAQAPVNTGPPSISGTPQQGATLTASTGTWTGDQPISFTLRWQRCDSKGGSCGDTSNHSQTFSLDSGDVGHTLRIVVTAKNAAGSTTATSSAVGPVAGPSAPPPPPPPAGACKSVSGVALPERLVVDRIEFNPSRIASRSQPLVARFHIATTRGQCVSGALVYAVGVPFDRLSKAPEVVSGGDGWATITFRVLPTFQLEKGNLVVVFVRARKQGDSVLAGVSTRRLVSVRVG